LPRAFTTAAARFPAQTVVVTYARFPLRRASFDDHAVGFVFEPPSPVLANESVVVWIEGKLASRVGADEPLLSTGGAGPHGLRRASLVNLL
jgi:hypothetical protein